MKQNKNDNAWEKIFKEHHILEKIENGDRVTISSTLINRYREARLMTKFDHLSQLPQIFSQQKLSILPISRGTYEIGKFETFHILSEVEAPLTYIEFPPLLESLDHTDINSEATAINCAFIAKILNDFTGEEHLFPTVSGRMSSSSFSFDIRSQSHRDHIRVENAQIEIDGGYEGDKSLCLIEAKNYVIDNFIIRQLYYPYRLWSGKITKRIRPIFLTYSNGIFSLREYEFQEPEFYNSIRLLQCRNYSIRKREITIETIRQILTNISIVEEPTVPFPQADSFQRIINLCELLNRNDFITKDDLTQNYAFDPRQTDYYVNAAKYLGLVEIVYKNNVKWCTLSQKGTKIFCMSIYERQIEFVKLILSHNVFHHCLQFYFSKDVMPTRNEIITIMQSVNLYKIDSLETYKRRATTITAWLKWILQLTT